MITHKIALISSCIVIKRSSALDVKTVTYFKLTWSTQSIHLVLEARGDHGYFHYTVLFSTDTAFRGICRHSFNTLYHLGVFTVDAIKRLTVFSDINFKCMSSILSYKFDWSSKDPPHLWEKPQLLYFYTYRKCTTIYKKYIRTRDSTGH